MSFVLVALRSVRLLASLGLLLSLPAVAAPTPDWAEIEAGFQQPPAAAKPKVLWFWMNGHVSREGITRDLEAMARVGAGEAIMFDGGSYLPAGPAGYLDANWRSLLGHAVSEAARLGLGFGMHNAPGWSSSGGPWITPDRAMQQLVWSEVTFTGGRRVELSLPQPYTNLGTYRDAFVIAFPALPAEVTPYEETLKSVRLASGREVPRTALSDGDYATKVAVTPQDYLQVEFVAPTELRAVTVFAGATGRFPTVNVEASADGVTYERIASLRNPGRHGIQPPAVSSFKPVRARFVRVVPTSAGELGEVVLHRTSRVTDWNFKANFAFRVGRQMTIPEPDGEATIDPATVRDLTAQVGADGRLAWDAPAGAWTLLRIGFTPTGQLNVSASAAGTGLECDKLSAAAIEFHFDHVIGQILKELGPERARAFGTVTVDSYEAGMQNWTAAMPAEFQRRTGYDLVPYLPVLAGGRQVGDAAIAERFLFDFRRAQADMMAELYYGRLGELCREHGLKYYVEGYGQGVLDELQISGLPDVPMTEFWQRNPWSPNRTVKMVSSAAHVYGKPIVAAEAFTGEEQTSRWQEYPYAQKALGDTMFGLGLNQMVFHRFAHQPHPDAVPGMTMGPWGFDFDRTNTWFEQSRGWLAYLARSQWLLRQGTYVADVLYFLGERPPNVAQYAMPVLPAGYNFDLINAEALLARASVRKGRIVLPDGGSYRVLMLPADLKGVTPEVMRKLREFAHQGVTIIGPKPVVSLTLRGYPESDAEVRRIADELWRDGKRVFADRPVADVLRELTPPDLEYVGRRADAALSWTHRSLPGAEIYFIGNRQRRAEDVTVTFRVREKAPELWHPETGQRTAAAVYAVDGDRIRMPLHLEPAESVFVVFRHEAAAEPAETLLKDGAPVLDARPPAAPAPGQTRGDFTMSIWAKPDIDLRLLPRESITGRHDETAKFYAIPAADGDVVFGEGHVFAGLAVGRNGAYVVERSTKSAPAVLVAEFPVAGWTHFAVVYRAGKPSLYVNGRFVREGLVSGAVVHPGTESPAPRPDSRFYFAGLDSVMRASGLPPPPSQGLAYYFEGNLGTPQLAARALTPDEIAAEAARGLPAPELTAAPELARQDDRTTEAMLWQSGTYTLGEATPVRVDVPAPQPVNGPWQVAFMPGRGAPASITLPELASLHRHADPGVRHYAGTATYSRMLDVPVTLLAPGHRLMLDLGRVEVAAEVKVNGRSAGLVWKEPYRVDVTDLVHAGANTLEVAVSTLWVNRLIGDEALPAENEYRQGQERGIKRVPDWYAQGAPKPPGGRTTFATWKFYSAGEPLVESGLLGPVRLQTGVRATFTVPEDQTAKAAAVPTAELQRVYEEVKTPYKYGVVIKGEEKEMVDCPNVFRFGNRWLMMYVAIKDQVGYQTYLAESDDLLHWRKLGRILSHPQEGWDAWQVDGGMALIDPTWGGSLAPEAFDGRYWASYIGGAKQGYEPDPLSIGLAWTRTPDEPQEWTRWKKNPILTPAQPDVRPWENVTLYKSSIIHDRTRQLGHPFVMFYNGKTKRGNHEAIGMAVSDDMVTWRRFGGPKPVVDNAPGKPAISGDPQIVRMGDLWVMFYFGFRWKPGAFDTFAVSRDLVHWTKWEGPHLVEPSEPWDKTFAHKPWLLKHDGVVYHYYCAVGDQGRVIALATSKDLRATPANK